MVRNDVSRIMGVTLKIVPDEPSREGMEPGPQSSCTRVGRIVPKVLLTGRNRGE